MLELASIGPATVGPATVAVGIVSSPQQMGNVHQSARFCYNRECLASCTERTVAVVRRYAPAFKLGASAGLLALGGMAAWFGFAGITQGFLDNNLSNVKRADLILSTGVIQFIAGTKLMNRVIDGYRARDFNENIIVIGGAGVGGAASYLPASKIGALVMGPPPLIQTAPEATRIAIAVLAQTASGVLIGGAAAITCVLLVESVIHLYHWAREARARRDNLDAAVELI
jgi:hypothetical protein